MKTAIYLDSFTEGLDDLPRKQQRDTRAVLTFLRDSPRKRFSVFEATANMDIARMMTRLVHEGYITTDHSCRYPWTKYELTPKALTLVGEGAANDS